MEDQIEVGATYRKGKQTRTVTGFASYLVLFRNGTGQRKGEAMWLFQKWMRGAVKVMHEQ